MQWLAVGAAALGAFIAAGIILAALLVVRRARRARAFPGAGKNRKRSTTAIAPFMGMRGGRRRTDQDSDWGVHLVTHPDFAQRETRLGEMIADMRELILRLTEIISKAGTASGDATGRFAHAKEALANLDIEDDDILTEVKGILLNEIDNVVKTNETLKQQLVAAESNMANQKKEIEVLKTTVWIDPLTQLPNRAAFDEYIAESMRRLRNNRQLFSLFMIDIDNFKRINDTYGHVDGDRILKGVAAKIKEMVRANDFACRYGGEEFAVIFPDTPSEEAFPVGERMRAAIEKSEFTIGDMVVGVTISGGIAQCAYERDPESFIAVADKAMYQSKAKGRNRITLGEDHIKEAWTMGEEELRIVDDDAPSGDGSAPASKPA